MLLSSIQLGCGLAELGVAALQALFLLGGFAVSRDRAAEVVAGPESWRDPTYAVWCVAAFVGILGYWIVGNSDLAVICVAMYVVVLVAQARHRLLGGSR